MTAMSSRVISMVLPSGSRSTCSERLGCPLVRETVSDSGVSMVTVATSDSRTGVTVAFPDAGLAGFEASLVYPTGRSRMESRLA